MRLRPFLANPVTNSDLGECSKRAITQKLTKCSMTTLVTVIIGTSNGDQTVTMFSGIIEDVVKHVEGASLTEKLLGAHAHKFHVTPKDIVLHSTHNPSCVRPL